MIEAIKELAVVLCGLLVIICIVEAILPEGSVSLTIKWVILLFIMFNLINSVKKIDSSELIEGFESSEEMVEIGGDEVLKQAEILLEDRIRILINSQGVNSNSINVEFFEDETGINVSAVYISDINEEDRAIVDDAVRTILGEETEVNYE